MWISIHAPREGSDLARHFRLVAEDHFNPRSPRGERPKGKGIYGQNTYFNPRSPRGERQMNQELSQSSFHFNPRSPRGERLPAVAGALTHLIFQSTLPARGATAAERYVVIRSYISIHAPREGSDRKEAKGGETMAHFNPRSPRGERRMWFPTWSTSGLFQSTLPARGATTWFYKF